MTTTVDTTFAELDLIEPIQRALSDEGYARPTPIQAQTIPLLLDERDVLGCAQTGTGKTAAFSLPILQHLAEQPTRGRRRIRALILTPTRELAAQIGESLAAYGKYLATTHTVIFGGVNERPQIRTLKQGVDVLVATPGRLLDLQGRGLCDLSQVELFVLDEADRMLDMGFIHDVRRVLKVLPRDRQNLLFSATLDPTIQELAGSFLHDPEYVAVTPQATTVERIEQSVMFVEKRDKRRLLVDLLQPGDVTRAIVFTRTKHGANRLVRHLSKAGVKAQAIHGNKSQGARTRALDAFRSGDLQALVATDIASRGIDVDDVSHVFNFDLPNEPESYVHRIGRTARAGREGVAVSFCDDSESDYLRQIERLTGQAIPRVLDHDYHFEAAVPGRGSAPAKPQPRGGGRSGGGRSSGRGRGRGGRRPQGGSGNARGRRTGRDRDGRSERGAQPASRSRTERSPRSSSEAARARPRDGEGAPANAPSFASRSRSSRPQEDGAGRSRRRRRRRR